MTITSVWKKLLGKPRLKVNKPNRLKLGLEHLEDRLTPAIVTWVNPASGDWSVPSNWSTGQLPGSTDDVQINLAGVTVTHSVGSDSVNSLTSSDPIILSGGTLSLASTSAVTANFTESGGTLAGAGNLSIGGLTWSGGSMNGAGQTVLSAGTTGTISGTVNKGLERTLNNFGSITYSGAHLYFDLNNNSPGVFNNEVGAVFTDATNSSISAKFANNGNLINNQGSFVNTGTGTAVVGVPINNSGTVNVNAGTLSFQGGGIETGVFTVAASAVLDFNVGTYAFNVGSINGAGTLSVSGGTVNFNTGIGITAVGITITAGSENFSTGNSISTGTMNLSGGTLTGNDTVTVTGSLPWSGGEMSGTGLTILATGATGTAMDA